MGAEYSPVISLTQDNAFHAINGVSWKWNSPQRFHGQIRMKAADARKSNHKPLLKLKHSETPAEAPKEATGFNKFISKLNLLMGKENVGENIAGPESAGLSVDTLEETDFQTAEHGQCEDQAHSESSEDDIFQQHCMEDAGDECGTLVDTAGRRPSESLDAFEHQFIDDELDDSKLDRILIEASQTVEQKLNNPTLPPPTVIPKRSEPDLSVPFEMNDSDMDGFLVQASLMVEEKLSDSSQESTSHKQGAVASTSEVTISQENLKALLEKKRQEALLRLQNNRLKRAMKGTNSNG
uniref:Uncharacterized protein n=1 Tax=Anopheles atroparvus TaxID=41427 RepID=A0A182J7N6_ANOAO